MTSNPAKAAASSASPRPPRVPSTDKLFTKYPGRGDPLGPICRRLGPRRPGEPVQLVESAAMVDHVSSTYLHTGGGASHCVAGQLADGLCFVFGPCYSGGMASMDRELHMSQVVGILGVSLYVLGFGLGPLVFAPLGELYGRRIVFIATGCIFTLFHMGGALGHNATTILVTRALAGIFGSTATAMDEDGDSSMQSNGAAPPGADEEDSLPPLREGPQAEEHAPRSVTARSLCPGRRPNAFLAGSNVG
ncbi:hypothetical protein NUW54_g3362 [Trametes sanguinea]|uniref:Uncharacterized protein n=1 Tax=Trametes sanguinea TaxID=158606 RepID=A0ACC1Q352_9APHY|nr:hypothetical protein NUW54_g3362 [Trametes sanguinea]